MAEKRENWDRTRLTLIGRLKNRDDRESWETFVDIYWRRMYSVAIGEGLTDAEAKDAAQETMIGVGKDIEKYDPALGHFRAWLMGRAKWRITDQLRKRKHQGQHAPSTRTSTRTDFLDRIPDEASLNRDEVLETEWKNYLFKLAVEKVKHQVKPAHFQIFDLHVLKKLPVEKVAAMVGVTPNAIYIIKHRLLAALEQEIKVLQNQSP